MGAQKGYLPRSQIASSVMAFGREERKNDCDHDTVVIYGDTNSVMIKFGYTDLEISVTLPTISKHPIKKSGVRESILTLPAHREAVRRFEMDGPTRSISRTSISYGAIGAVSCMMS